MTEKSLIHSTAVVSEKARIGKNVTIGPFTVIGPDVVIGDDNIIGPHVVIEGPTIIGVGNRFFQFGSIGADPQDYSYKGEPTRLEIGNRNVFREGVTINRGTLKEKGLTKIGDTSLFMAYVHVGHDCIIGNKCTIANGVNIAGHVRIEDYVIIGGNTGISQFTTLGRGSYLAGASGIDHDIPPFCTAMGNRVKLKGINIVGLKRLDYSRQVISEVVEFYRMMESSSFSAKAFVSKEENWVAFKENEIVLSIVEHIKKSEVGVAPFVS